MKSKSWKFYVIVLSFMCLTAEVTTGEAKVPAIKWERSYGGSGNDRPYAIQQSKDDGYILVGNSESRNGDVSGNHCGSDFGVVKLKPKS